MTVDGLVLESGRLRRAHVQLDPKQETLCSEGKQEPLEQWGESLSFPIFQFLESLSSSCPCWDPHLCLFLDPLLGVKYVFLCFNMDFCLNPSFRHFFEGSSDRHSLQQEYRSFPIKRSHFLIFSKLSFLKKGTHRGWNLLVPIRRG